MEAESRSSASSSDGTKTQKYNKVTTTLDLGFRDLCFTTGKGKTTVYIHDCNLGIMKTFSPLGVFTDIYLPAFLNQLRISQGDIFDCVQTRMFT